MFAQKLEMSMGINMGPGYIDYSWHDDFTNNEPDNSEFFGPNAYFYLTGKISQHLFLKSTISANDYKTFVDIKYNIDGIDYIILKYITVSQYILSIAPEYRYKMNKSTTLFANAGISINKVQSSSNENLTGVFNTTRFGLLANVGVNLKIKENLGVTMGLGFDKESKFQQNIPTISVHKYFLQMGILYSID